MRGKLPAILLLALFVILGALTWLVPEHEDLGERSAQSSKDSGRRGLLLLLREFQFDARRWEKRPGELPTRAGMVWLARLPVDVGPEPSSEASESGSGAATPLQDARRRGLSNPEHYRRFAAQGGSVFVEISNAQVLARLARDFGFFEVETLGLTPRTVDPEALERPAECKWISGEPIALSAPEASAFSGLDGLGLVDVLLEDGAASALIVEVPIGRGRLVLASCATAFDNARISLHDHAVLAIRLAERASHAGAIWIDESSGFGGNAPTLTQLALHPRALPFSAALALLGLLFAWRSLFAREIPRDPPPLEFMSPRTRALARARLFQRARRFDLLAQGLRRASALRIGEASRIPLSTCIEALQSVDGARRFALAIGAGGDAQRWVDALVAKPAASARDLAQLDSDLRELEDQQLSRVRLARPRRAR